MEKQQIYVSAHDGHKLRGATRRVRPQTRAAQLSSSFRPLKLPLFGEEIKADAPPHWMSQMTSLGIGIGISSSWLGNWGLSAGLLLLQPKPRWADDGGIEGMIEEPGCGSVLCETTVVCTRSNLLSVRFPVCSDPCRDYPEGEERSEALLPAHHRQQMPLRRVDHPDGGLLGRGPRRQAGLWPHQDLCGQT